MGVKVGFLLALVAAAFLVAVQIEPKRNKILFKSGVNEVADAILSMERLLNKFPKTNMVNYFVDNDGYLYLNNQKIASIQGAINNPRVRNDMVFRDFKDEEIDQFFKLMSYLWSNDIQLAFKEPTLDKFVFSFGESEPSNNKDVRLLMYTRNQSDT